MSKSLQSTPGIWVRTVFEPFCELWQVFWCQHAATWEALITSAPWWWCALREHVYERLSLQESCSLEGQNNTGISRARSKHCRSSVSRRTVGILPVKCKRRAVVCKLNSGVESAERRCVVWSTWPPGISHLTRQIRIKYQPKPQPVPV